MDALRHSLLAPSCGTFVMVLGCVDSMMAMIKVRYSAKDDDGKPLLPHPYKPWEIPGGGGDEKDGGKHAAIADKAYRAFKMFENVKEWTAMSLPFMWTFAVYGKGMAGCPYVSDDLVDGAVVLSSLVYAYANRKYTRAYIESTEKRTKSFYLRTNVVKFWLAGSAISLFHGILKRLGVV